MLNAMDPTPMAATVQMSRWEGNPLGVNPFIIAKTDRPACVVIMWNVVNVHTNLNS